jgi:hypothetical protein
MGFFSFLKIREGKSFLLSIRFSNQLGSIKLSEFKGSSRKLAVKNFKQRRLKHKFHSTSTCPRDAHAKK